MSVLSAGLFQRIESAPAVVATNSETAKFLTFWFVLAAALLGAAVAINDGRLHWLGLQWLALAILAMAGSMVLCRGRMVRFASPRLIDAAMIAVIAFQIAHLLLVGPLTTAETSLPFGALAGCLGVMTAGIGLARFSRFLVAGSGLIVGGFAVLGWSTIWTSPDVRIDVLQFQTEAASRVLDGGNPYATRYRNIYHPHTEFYGPGVVENGWLTFSFPYPPLSLLLVLPGQLLGDVRYAHLAAMTLAGLLLILAGRNRCSILAASLLLTSPRVPCVLSAGWTEPLLIFLAAGLLFLALRWRRGLWIGLGLLLAVKQYLVLLIPLTKLLGPTMGSRRGWRQMVLGAGLLALVASVPYVAAEPRAAFRSLVQWQLVQPFRYDALSFAAMRGQLTGEESAGWAGFAAAALAISLGLWKAPRTPGGMMAAAGLLFVSFFALNKQAFCNYYLFVIGLCACAMVGFSGEVDSDVASADRDVQRLTI